MSLTTDGTPDAGFWLVAAADLLHGRLPAGTDPAGGGEASGSTQNMVLVNGTDASAPGGWLPKAGACLTRLALEAGIDAFWTRVEPAVAECRSRRAQLLMLRRRAGRDLARSITYAWVTLSRFTHCQCYDPTPTIRELANLHREAGQLLQVLSEASERPRPSGT